MHKRVDGCWCDVKAPRASEEIQHAIVLKQRACAKVELATTHGSMAARRALQSLLLQLQLGQFTTGHSLAVVSVDVGWQEEREGSCSHRAEKTLPLPTRLASHVTPTSNTLLSPMVIGSSLLHETRRRPYSKDEQTDGPMKVTWHNKGMIAFWSQNVARAVRVSSCETTHVLRMSASSSMRHPAPMTIGPPSAKIRHDG